MSSVALSDAGKQCSHRHRSWLAISSISRLLNDNRGSAPSDCSAVHERVSPQRFFRKLLIADGVAPVWISAPVFPPGGFFIDFRTSRNRLAAQNVENPRGDQTAHVQ